MVLMRRLHSEICSGVPPSSPRSTPFKGITGRRLRELMVDRLLDLAAYGERWRQFWMNDAGATRNYGGTHKIEDRLVSNAWQISRLRIRSLNAEYKLTTISHEQIAGDALVGSYKRADEDYPRQVIPEEAGGITWGFEDRSPMGSNEFGNVVLHGSGIYSHSRRRSD